MTSLMSPWVMTSLETRGRLVEHDELRLLAGHSYPDHHVGCLDDGPSLIPGLEIEISDGFVRDCGCNDDPIADVDADMGRRSTFLDFDDLALELITRAQLLHGQLLSKIRCYGRRHALPRPPSAIASIGCPILYPSLIAWVMILKERLFEELRPYWGSARAAKPYFANTGLPWIEKINMANW